MSEIYYRSQLFFLYVYVHVYELGSPLCGRLREEQEAANGAVCVLPKQNLI